MSGDGANGTSGTEWAQVFADFHARHTDGNGKKLKYTAVFNAAMDAFITCLEVPFEWRMLAFIWRKSWGNNSDYCVERIGGAAISQQGAADTFGVDKQRVNDAAMILRALNFVRAKTGHRLYPVDNPGEAQRESPAPNGLSDGDESPAPNGLFGVFCDQWKSAHRADFEKLQSAEDTVSQIKKVRLGEYREWKRARTSTGTSLYTTLPTSPTVDGQSVGSLEEDRPTDRPGEVYDYLMNRLGDLLPGEEPGPKLCEEIAAAIGDMPLTELDPILQRKQKKITSMGMVLPFSQEARRCWNLDAEKRQADQRRNAAAEVHRLQEQKQTWREILSDPNSDDEARAAAAEFLAEIDGEIAKSAGG